MSIPRSRDVLAALAIVACTVPIPAFAGGGRSKPGLPKVQAYGVDGKTQLVFTGPAVEQQVAKLTKVVSWTRDLDEAKARAVEQKRPIFWLHVLGELDGFC